MTQAKIPFSMWVNSGWPCSRLALANIITPGAYSSADNSRYLTPPAYSNQTA
ncbi:hypothetical protein D3C71_1856150 [compost metagenome]